MATALIMGTLLGAGFTSVITVVRPTAEAKQAADRGSVCGRAGSLRTPELRAPGLAAGEGIEVTGFRIQTDPAKKSEIQYLVVNHSPARFSGVNGLRDALRGRRQGRPAAALQVPVHGAQSGSVPGERHDQRHRTHHAPGESVPDWQDLRASVEIGQ